MSKAVTADPGAVRVSGEMTIFSAAGLKQPLLDGVQKAQQKAGSADALGMDLSQVTDFDTAGLQLVLLARQAAAGAGRGFEVTAASNVVREAFALCGAVGLLADAPSGEVVL